ncbi:hypothetical protein MUK42_36596 [Musa troglodytarum]|uniref:Uncharacterized protein n=1 Tax=Musa troglodytarum TaxID=320322 RepID=A0A9E7KBN8_9LILI|nr:hypothetical protein MUK42_36596 [Musa troglodytarum]
MMLDRRELQKKQEDKHVLEELLDSIKGEIKMKYDGMQLLYSGANMIDEGDNLANEMDFIKG